jgi:hypothetical protein
MRRFHPYTELQKVFCFAFVLCSASFFITSISAMSQSTNYSWHYDLYIDTLVTNNGNKFFRWENPITYTLYGMNNEEEKDIIDLFLLAESITGLKITQDKSIHRKNTNKIIVYLNSLDQAPNDLWQILKGSEETEESTKSRVETSFKKGFISIFRRNDDNIFFSIDLVNRNIFNEKSRNLASYFVFSTLNISNHQVDHSMIRTKYPDSSFYTATKATDFSKFDQYFLKEIYSNRVRSGDPTSNVGAHLKKHLRSIYPE